MTQLEEEYVHFVECMDSLQRAWMWLGALREAKVPPALRTAAYERALIEYAKPFKASEGMHFKRYRWSAPSLPPDALALHTRIITLRDKALAHSDLTLKDARVHVSTAEGLPVMTVVQNMPAELPPLEKVIELTESILRAKFPELERLDRALAQRD